MGSGRLAMRGIPGVAPPLAHSASIARRTSTNALLAAGFDGDERLVVVRERGIVVRVHA